MPKEQMESTSSIDQWQKRLERHFASLARMREGSGFPLFALEHGLAEGEVVEISRLLRSRLKNGDKLSPHWLVWVVHAAESGYGYTGGEYWRSFEEQTPGWQFADRYRIAQWFKKFRDTYHGVTPSGPWAGHFRIIAWPITHAILPRYLQRLFARALYDLRFHLAATDAADSATIGRTLATRAVHVTTRFEEFLQQEELTGRIVLALFDEAPTEGEEPIYPLTLDRIVGDLERVRQSRDWLKEARRVARDRFRGVAKLSSPAESSSPGAAPVGIAALSIRPSLFLRHTGQGHWSLGMEIPAFRAIAMLRSDIRTFLKRTRCRLNGAAEPKPAGWLISGTRRALLESWPDVTKPLIRFEQSHHVMDHILETDCRLGEGPVWVFRISPDGSAREIKGRIVRPGSAYILVTAGPLPEMRDGIRPCCINCAGVNAFRLSVPPNVTADDVVRLDVLGVQVARTIRLWPAGLVARGWDGEGHTEWLTSESPCFGVVHDHPIDGYVVRLDHGSPQIIEAGPVGTPLFFRVPPLPRGTYNLEIKAQQSGSFAPIVKSPPAEGAVEIRVREPEPWIPKIASHSGMVVSLDPYDSDLDEFWENRVSLSVYGPPSHRAHFHVSLEATDGKELLSEQVGGLMELPVTPELWRERFGQFADREKNAWSYLEAAAGTLKVSGSELGEYTRRLERDLTPVRWVLTRDQRRIIVRLIDDSDQEGGDVIVTYHSLDRPLTAIGLEPDSIRAGQPVKTPGGLFLAQRGEYRDALVVSAGVSSGGLRGLGVTASFDEIRAGEVTPRDAIASIEQWRCARLAGFLAEIRRNHVVEGILCAIYARIGGAKWAGAEAAYIEDPASTRTTDLLRGAVTRHGGFAAVLYRDYEIMNRDPTEGSQWFADRAQRFTISSDRPLCEFALRLAGCPQGLSEVYGNELDLLLKKLSSEPTLLRGARLLALLCANEKKEPPGRILPRWTW